MLSRVISKATEEWVFIDTPPGDPAVINEAIELAGFVIVPSPVAPEDFNHAVRTLGTTGDTPAALFLCHWDKRATKTYEAIKEAIEDQDLPVFDLEAPNKQQRRKRMREKLHTQKQCSEKPPQRLENLPSTSKRRPISSYVNKLLNKN